MEKYRYSKEWFLVSEIREKLLNCLDEYEKNTILEIGCFEGLSSVFFADNLLNHTDSTLTCVDPFLNIDNNDHGEYLSNNEEANFDYNIQACKFPNKIEINKITSDEFFKLNTKTFNLIYIDGCHECDFIIRDMENSFKILEKGGIMWMDDYRGGDGIKIRETIDAVLEKYKGQYILLFSGYQLAIRKIV
jgi:predicted O-methyltransferase YrrM